MTSLRSISSALLLLAAPLLGQSQSIGGLTARATANAIALRPTSLQGAALQDLQFSYSRDAGATWKPIEASCLEFVSGEAIWHVLECLQVDVFEGSNIQFKASAGACDPVAFDGYTYEVAQIGAQCWFAENLRSTHYANGDEIPGGLTQEEWEGASFGAQAVYGEGSSECYTEPCNEVDNLVHFGRLYNWYAVNDSRGLCPIGWHVPTDAEYSELTDVMGGRAVAGIKMSSSLEDAPSWYGTNDFGFSGLPGSFRSTNGSFSYLGDFAYFWSSSPSDSLPSAWGLSHGEHQVFWKKFNEPLGFSVRCVRG